jgi:hypothetical protein
MRRQIGELHRKIKAQVVALERGIEPEGLGANRRSPRLEDAGATAAIGASGGAGRRVSPGGTDLRMTSPGGRRPGHPDRLIERVVAGPTALPAGAAPLRLRHDSWLPGAYNAEATGALPSDSSISPGIDIASKLREATESRGEPSGGQLRGAGLAFPLTTETEELAHLRVVEVPVVDTEPGQVESRLLIFEIELLDGRREGSPTNALVVAGVRSKAASPLRGRLILAN